MDLALKGWSVHQINEGKPLTVPGTRNTGTNYADLRYQLLQIDSRVLRAALRFLLLAGGFVQNQSSLGPCRVQKTEMVAVW